MANIDGNDVLRKIKAKRSKTPQNSGTISVNGKVLASVRDSIPTVGRDTQPKPLTKK